MNAVASLNTAICAQYGLDYPIFGFTHDRAVVAAISRAGGMGVFGAAYFTPEQVDEDLVWIAEQCQGRPFGVDVMIPSVGETVDESDLGAMLVQLSQRIPAAHREFVESLLTRFGVGPLPDGVEVADVFPLGPSRQAAERHIESALRRGASLIVSALGVPPDDAVTEAHRQGVKMGGMVGSPKHAKHHLRAGVDLVIAQGSEAAAHAGEISTMVLVPEVVDACGSIPVLAAGGIATGRQFLAARALGAQGIWTGSMWRTAAENTESKGVVELLLKAGSGDTVRSRCMTGKELRQLRSPWNDAWSEPGAAVPLPMPLQRMSVTEAEQRIEYHGRDELVVSPIGQVVGQLNEVKPAAELIADLVAGYEAALGGLA
ncbi:MAG: NAD(P)H-dependent flavin oxidoreductase [Acidimicrobiia bacterium]